MIGVHQTHFAGSILAQVPGNCIQAAVASVLELPLEAVPHFLLFGSQWQTALISFLSARGMSLRVWTDNGGWASYWESINVPTAPLAQAPTDSVVISSGPSPRGDFLHVAVFQAGVLLHDPNPAGGGFAGDPVEIWSIA